jgi:hypothetical protein
MWQFYLVLIMVVEDDAPGLEIRLNNRLHKLNKAFFPAEQFYLTVSISRAGPEKNKISLLGCVRRQKSGLPFHRLTQPVA